MTQERQKQDRHPFSLFHIKDAIVTTFKPRPGPNRKYMLLFLVVLSICKAQFEGELSTAYYYVRTRYQWEVIEYSNYLSITAYASIIG